MIDQKYCVICDNDHTTAPEMILARWHDQDICTDCLAQRPGTEEAEAEAPGRPAATPAIPPLRPRFVRCEACDDIYPRPQSGPCPTCEDPEPIWHAWDPRTEECPDIRQIPDILVGLLMLLEEYRYGLQDRAGCLYESVKDALIVISQDNSAAPFHAFEDFYLQKG